MPDEVDELILKMQHLTAHARAQREAEVLAARGKSLKSRAQQIAWAAQAELSAAEAQQREGEEKLQSARDPALPAIAAADLLQEGRRLSSEGRTKAIKARAKLNFALDQLDEADRREYEALRAEARAEAHAQMAEDPLFDKGPLPAAPTSSANRAPPAGAKPAGSTPETRPSGVAKPAGKSGGEQSASQTAPRKTLGPRRRKGS
jgi:hypothetical protein